MPNLGYLPARIIGGETIIVSAASPLEDRRDIRIDGYSPATGARLAYTFQASKPLTVEAVPNPESTGWRLTVGSAETLTLGPGLVGYVGVLTAGEAVKVVDSGTVSVAASPLRANSWLAMIAAIDNALLNIASNPAGQISIDGMTVSYRSADQLTRLRDYAQGQAAREQGRSAAYIMRGRYSVR